MIISIVGPTGVGKTKLSVELAKKFNAIIINNDAMQVYKQMNIGTAKPSVRERDNVPHYLLDFVDVNTNYTVFDYQKDVRKILDNNKNKNIIMVGGTGLYLKAALFDYRFEQEQESCDYSNMSNDELYDLVLKKDSATKIHKNNRQRLIRFLNKKNTDIVEPKQLYNAIFIGLTTSRDNLYKRIDDRVDEMIKEGLVDEVKELYKKYKDVKPLISAIGYKEIIKYLKEEASLQEAIEEIKKNSRHYAKRQYTFINNQLPIKWFNTNYDNFDKTIKEIISYIENS